MTTLSDYFLTLRNRKKKAFIPYFTAGYPSPEWTPRILQAAARAGATAIELGVPFSDPVADGPVLQKANFQALEQGMTLHGVLEIARKASKEIAIPILLMGYANPFLQQGWKSLAKKAQGAGIKGLIVADLPLEEAKDLSRLLEEFDLALNLLCAPTTAENRMKAMDALCTGFIYLVAVKGVTGAREALPKELIPFLKKTRKIVEKPLCVGFGLSTPEQAKTIAREADGIILGSKIASFLEEHQSDSRLDEHLQAYLSEWKSAVQC